MARLKEQEIQRRVAINRLHELIQFEADHLKSQKSSLTPVLNDSDVDLFTNKEIAENALKLGKRLSELTEHTTKSQYQANLYQQVILDLQTKWLTQCIHDETVKAELSFMEKLSNLTKLIIKALSPSILFANIAFALTHPKQTADNAFKSIINFFRVAKKAIDLVDDIWIAASKKLNPVVIANIGAILLGGIGFIIFSLEGYEAAQRMRKLWKSRAQESGERFFKTKLGAAVVAMVCVIAGIGISLAIIATKFGAVVADATTVLPNLMPILLAVIVAANTFRKGYVYFQLRRDLDIARKNFEEAQLVMKLAHTGFKNCPTLHNAESYKNAVTDLSKQDEIYIKVKRDHAVARRKLIFAVLESIAITIAVVGTVLGMVAASAASFGAAPMALLYAGIVLGLLIKLFEVVDKKYDHRPSKWLKQFFFGSKTAEKMNEIKKDKTNSPKVGRVAETDIELVEVPQPSLSTKIEHAAPMVVPDVISPVVQVSIYKNPLLMFKAEGRIVHSLSDPTVSNSTSVVRQTEKRSVIKR